MPEDPKDPKFVVVALSSLLYMALVYVVVKTLPILAASL